MELIRPESCERARQWASQRMDGELSQLELARLERHIGGCVHCRTFAGRVAEVGSLLRSAPLARLSRPVRIELLVGPRLRGLLTRALPLSVAGALGIVAAAALLAVTLPAPHVVAHLHAQLSADNGRSDLDAQRLVAALAQLGPAPAWVGHGPTT